MLDFLKTKIEFFGLDVSDTSVRIAKISGKRGRRAMVSYGEKKLDPGIIVMGKVNSEESLALAIKDLARNIKGEKLGLKYVAASLPEEKAFHQVIEMPEMSKEDLRKSAVYEAESHIPLPINDVYFDFQEIPSGKKKNRLSILMAALPKKIVDPYVLAIEKAGFSLAAMEVESMSIVRCLLKKEEKDPVLLIDIGDAKMSLVIFSDKSIRFTSSSFVSSGDFTKKISEDIGVSLAEADDLKIKYGIIGKEREDICKALDPLLDDISKMIKKHVDYYESYDSPGTIKKVIICGGGANLKGLPEFLAERIGIEVEKGDPFVNFSRNGHGTSKEEFFGYEVAFGLALRNFKQ